MVGISFNWDIHILYLVLQSTFIISMDMPDILNRGIYCDMKDYLKTDIAIIQNVMKPNDSQNVIYCDIKYVSSDDGFRIEFTSWRNMCSISSVINLYDGDSEFEISDEYQKKRQKSLDCNIVPKPLFSRRYLLLRLERLNENFISEVGYQALITSFKFISHIGVCDNDYFMCPSNIHNSSSLVPRQAPPTFVCMKQKFRCDRNSNCFNSSDEKNCSGVRRTNGGFPNLWHILLMVVVAILFVIALRFLVTQCCTSDTDDLSETKSYDLQTNGLEVQFQGDLQIENKQGSSDENSIICEPLISKETKLISEDCNDVEKITDEGELKIQD